MADPEDPGSDSIQNQDEMIQDEELDEKQVKHRLSLAIQTKQNSRYPNRPRNHSETLPFHALHLTLFNPLNDNRKRQSGPVISRKKRGPHGPSNYTPHETRQHIIERFISRWRKEVGDDIHPAFRLIIPSKDRERPMYGLKENTIAKLLIDVMKVNKQSEDGYSLLNWKQPGTITVSRMAGDFAGRCYEVISKRPMRVRPGEMTISQVNSLLDKLAGSSKKEAQLPIFAEFYNKMNADELMWLIRIILRQMKVGATERTFFSIWHPDADSLFNVSSNLRRVCWELYDPSVRLESDETGVTLMQCFQPQLAQFQMRTFQIMVSRMRPTEEDPKFWIEEKLDGERMQLHMIQDDETPGGKRFNFWSRKAKDYTYLYGNGFFDDNSALTRHLKDAFHEGVENIILDGEMITWDPEQDAMVPFGTLKTAANLQQANPYSAGWRPFYKVFDILFLNGQALTNYTLRDRRRALQSAVMNVSRRMEIHPYHEAEDESEVEPLLRKVVQDASEGLVLKNPRSAYRLNERNDDWIKVKPEYLTEFGENLDCCIIGGYYGSGHRGGKLAAFLCGLRVDDNQIRQGADPMKFFSFFKVGGGFTAADYQAIRHQTEGKWKTWDQKRPPSNYIALAGDHLQIERPDVWILPSDSLVVEVKAASVASTESFKMGFTLRFPRFKKIRSDRNWENALSISEFFNLKNKAEQEHKENQLRIDDSRKKRPHKPRKKQVLVAGTQAKYAAPYAGASTNVFQGLDLFIMTGSQKPQKKSKAELEEMVKSHGATLHQSNSTPGVICIGENRTVHVASAIKRGKNSIVKPSWLFDNIKQSQDDQGRCTLLLPLEPRHLLFTASDTADLVQLSVDQNMDSYARDVTVPELRDVLHLMPIEPKRRAPAVSKIRAELIEEHADLAGLAGWMFEGLILFFHAHETMRKDPQSSRVGEAKDRKERARTIARFAGARTVDHLQKEVTHIITSDAPEENQKLRQEISQFARLPRMVDLGWIEQSWREKTRLDEERFTPIQ